tara:strand:- start:143816 stop:144490 length:675 start_codon:yes stop_codon:yes gene_type:complete
MALMGFSSSFSQNKVDANGERHGIWKKYYSNDRLRYVGSFEHGKEVGVFKYYSAASSEFPVVIKEFNKNDDVADVKFYTVNGIIESKGLMKGKNREGKWIYFHEDGKTVMSEETYKDGKLDGPYKTFYNTGKPTEIANYKDGLLNGSYKKYSIKGHIYQDFNYQDGRLNGSASYFNRKTGELTTKGTFRDDVRVGTWENYVDGELVSTEQPNKKIIREKKTKNE